MITDSVKGDLALFRRVKELRAKKLRPSVCKAKGFGDCHYYLYTRSKREGVDTPVYTVYRIDDAHFNQNFEASRFKGGFTIVMGYEKMRKLADGLL